MKGLLCGFICLVLILGLFPCVPVQAGTSTVSSNFQTTAANNNTLQYSSDEMVVFSDPNLEAVIRDAINKPSGDIYQSDVLSLYQVISVSNSISNLSGLEFCTNLQKLVLIDNPISDITPLASLENLQELELGRTIISDISALANLKYLKYLHLKSNRIVDISALSKLMNIQNLELSGNQVIDISVLGSLINLQYLGLAGNQINDLSALANLVNLNHLYLNNNNIVDFSPLADLVNLQDVDLSYNQISQLSTQINMVKLIKLDISHNQLNVISALYNLENLQYLDLNNNRITDISSLSSLVNLENLNLRNNQIIDISPLANLINLKIVYACGNQISDITPLANLTTIPSLYFNNNRITNITALANLTNIKDLNLNNNQISDVSPLAVLENLVELNLIGNQIADISPFVLNTGLSIGDKIDLQANPLSFDSINIYIPELQTRGIVVTFDNPIEITVHPASQTVCTGEFVTFIAAAGGIPAPTVQWQFSADSGESWEDIAEATSETLQFTVAATDDGKQYRAVFTNNHSSADTDAALLTIKEFVITASSDPEGVITPMGEVKVKCGENPTFLITAVNEYHIEAIFIDGQPSIIFPSGERRIETIYTFFHVNANHSIQVTFDFDDPFPRLPHAFWGNLTICGKPAPVGTVVEARGIGVKVGIEGNPITTTESGFYGGQKALQPKLIVQGEVPQGSDLTFWINGIQARETSAYQKGEASRLDLTVNQFAVNLCQGWNTFAVPFALDTSEDTWGEFAAFNELNVVAGYLFDAETGQWQQIEDDDVIQPLVGFYLKLADAGTAKIIMSSEQTTASTIRLLPGLNCVGAASAVDTDLLSYLESIYEISGAAGYILAHNPPINAPNDWSNNLYLRDDESIPTIKAGKVYWIFMQNPGTLKSQ